MRRTVTILCKSLKIWWARKDSNLRPMDYESTTISRPLYKPITYAHRSHANVTQDDRKSQEWTLVGHILVTRSREPRTNRVTLLCADRLACPCRGCSPLFPAPSHVVIPRPSGPTMNLFIKVVLHKNWNTKCDDRS